MFLIILLLQIVNAQEIEFDIRDNSLYEYNSNQTIYEGIELELDSVRFFNSELGIDTTLKYSKTIDLKEIFIINSVKNDIIPIEINLNNNSISVKSYENIKYITVYDLLGNEVINKNLNSKEVTLNHNFNNFLYFVQIRNDKNIYNTKVLKAQNSNLISKSIIMSEDNWKITLYKFAFKPKTLEYSILPSKIEEELQRIKLKIDYNFDIDSIKESSEYRLSNTYGNDTININFNKNTVLYDTISKSGFRIEDTVINNIFVKREHNSFISTKGNTDYCFYIDSLYFFKGIYLGLSYTKYAETWGEVFELELNETIDLKPLYNREISNINYFLKIGNSKWNYEYGYVDSYSPSTYESIFKSKLGISKINGTIKISIVE